VKASRAVGVALVSIVVAACGGGSSKQLRSPSASTGKPGATSRSDASPSCHALTSADFGTIRATTPAKVEQLANSVGQRRTCSDVFVDASGGLILVITKTPGGRGELASARETARGAAAAARPRPLPGIPGGFIVGQQVGFLERNQVVSLTTGYTTAGQPELTTTQLARLAGIVAQH
jgi:hypothetical protein